MLPDFVKKKFSDYSKLVEFSGGKTSYRKIRESSLPAFIINFFDCSLPHKDAPISKKEFDAILNKAIVFNVNYIIKPKNTIIKFLYGDVETRPVEFIREKLAYFQFYGYYVNHINDFINMNSLDIVSVNQVEHIIDDINKRLLEEIRDTSNGDAQRLNLVKLLYYFFVDLTENNPINIKLPKKILSVFLNDKGFTAIKAKVNAFFSDEIFIQEAIELMNPVSKRTGKAKSDDGMSEKQVKEIASKAKTSLINNETLNKDLASIRALKEKRSAEEKLPEIEPPVELKTSIKITPSNEIKDEIKTPVEKKTEKEKTKEKTVEAKTPEVTILPVQEKTPHAGEKTADVKPIRESETKMPDVEPKTLVINEEIYSSELLLESQFSSVKPEEALTDKGVREKLLIDLFIEKSYRKKIIKKIFHKNETHFKEEVGKLLCCSSWSEAIPVIEDIFKANKVNFYSDAAVRFVDIMQSHFTRTTVYSSQKQQGT